MENRKYNSQIIILVIIIMMVCTSCAGDPIASAYFWNDSNCNGIQDIGEVPISNICINLVYQPNAPTPSESECKQPYTRSNERGYWTSGAFVDCNGAYQVFRIPTGYELTTNVSNKGCKIKFGLVLEGTCNK